MPVGYTPAHADAMLALIDGHYVQLHSGDPGAAGTANVIAGVARALLALGAGATVGSDRVRSPNAQLEFDAMPVGDITHFSIWTANAAGTFKLSGTITPTKTIANAGDKFILPVGDLDFILGPVAS